MLSSMKLSACFMAPCGCSVTFLLDRPAALQSSHRKDRPSSGPGCAITI